MSLSADEILACTTAHELFGDAVHDRRGLKRAYAALIKTWGPDAHPEVFRHIRDLYEAAKRGDTGAPEPEVERPTLRLVRNDEEPEPEPDATPAERLRAAMEGGDPDAALEVLDAHDLDLRIDHPGLWFASVATLADLRTFSLPAEVLQSWLDAVDGAPDMIPATMLDRIELLTGTGVAYQAARQDEAIEPALLDLLALWGKDAVTVAEGFIALGEALPDDEAAWEAHQTLKVRYPGLWFPYTLLKNQVTREVDSYEEAASEQLARAPTTEWSSTWKKAVPSITVRGVLVFLAVTWTALLVTLFGPDSRDADVGNALVAMVFFAPASAVLLWEAHRKKRTYNTVNTDYAEVSEALRVRARIESLFPNEALDRALPLRETAPPEVLLRWQQDPTPLLRILTPAHLDRIRARDAAAQETE